ncbi:hypothetical protein B4917_07050 [Helicobacter pylori]|uniref:Putative n=1 Tax=Helicobacter pylori (strain J99 / ATCC 700824) TaxID=85963 RepID=Q9ZKJ2_HELPJ|nr:putative [Helicobacter pylori J99]AVL48111.1 hypothetical protein CEP79_00460 [Helicobacter pylori]AVL48112.1 hypothetical protein CEP79_00465 [Helicobacter pylori]ORJ07514.1 hypothetical protein B4U47_07595 [Helicobacter pylori]ORJ09098.1 hypothetical protein B4917_07050 [Helicobacter pylori]
MTWAFFFFLKISLNHVDRNLQKKEKVKKRKNSIIKRDKLTERAIRLVVARFSLRKVFNFFY